MTDQFALTADQLAIQDMARKFTADQITPFAAQWDKDCHYPVEVWKAAGELGFGAIYVSEESGGTGLGRLDAALIMEAMAYGCPATSAYISIHNMAAWMIDQFGGAKLKAKYLPALSKLVARSTQTQEPTTFSKPNGAKLSWLPSSQTTVPMKKQFT